MLGLVWQTRHLNAISDNILFLGEKENDSILQSHFLELNDSY